MKKNLLIAILLVFLVVMNLTLLFLLFQRPPKRPKPPHAFVVEELQFNDTQMKAFEQLEQEFRMSMGPIHHEQARLKAKLFSGFTDQRDSKEAIDSITSLIGNLAKEQDQRVYNHFRAIYKLCDDEQRDKFNQILNKALHSAVKKGPGPPPHP